MGVDFNMKIAIFACKHDNSTNISRIGPKLIPRMYLRSVLVCLMDELDLYFEVIGVDFKMKFVYL